MSGEPRTDSLALGIAYRIILVLPIAVAVAGADLAKYRGWRERCAKWARDHQVPPAEYQRDNVLWRVRITSLAVGVVAFIACIAVVFATDNDVWLFGVLYTVSIVACAGWSSMRGKVR